MYTDLIIRFCNVFFDR